MNIDWTEDEHKVVVDTMTAMVNVARQRIADRPELRVSYLAIRLALAETALAKLRDADPRVGHRHRDI